MLRKHKRIRKMIYKMKPKLLVNLGSVEYEVNFEKITTSIVSDASAPITNTITQSERQFFRSEVSKQFDIKQHEDKQQITKSPRERFEANIKMLSDVMNSIRS